VNLAWKRFAYFLLWCFVALFLALIHRTINIRASFYHQILLVTVLFEFSRVFSFDFGFASEWPKAVVATFEQAADIDLSSSFLTRHSAKCFSESSGRS
jgi:hypothetical protein